jgi:hypothetical protein
MPISSNQAQAYTLNNEYMPTYEMFIAGFSKVWESRSAARNDTDYLVMAAIDDLLKTELCKNTDAWPFLRPVTSRVAPNYGEFVKTPMDLAKVRNKLNNGRYKQARELISDIRLIFENCKKYVAGTSEVKECGMRLHQLFERRLAEITSNCADMQTSDIDRA